MEEDFEIVFNKVKPIVWKLSRYYFIKMWTREDWQQEGMLILHQLLREHPELEEDDTKLYIYFKTRFSNYIKDVLRQQESQKRRFNRMSYEEVGFGSIVTSAFAAAHPNSLALLSLINPISEPALEGSQRVASRLASLYYRAGAALPEKIGYPLLRSQLITRASSEVMMRTKDKAMRRFINGQHAAYFGSFGSRRGVLSAYEASITHTAAEYAAAIRVPVQMLVAEDDDLGTPETARAMYATLTSRSLPASSSGARERLDMIPEVGHLIHYETPRRAAELIADFAADHSGNEK